MKKADITKDRFVVVSGASTTLFRNRHVLAEQFETRVTLVPTEQHGVPEGVIPHTNEFSVSHTAHFGTVEEHVEHYREQLTEAFNLLTLADDPREIQIPSLASYDLTPQNECWARNGMTGPHTLPLATPEQLAAVGYKPWATQDKPKDKITRYFSYQFVPADPKLAAPVYGMVVAKNKDHAFDVARVSMEKKRFWDAVPPGELTVEEQIILDDGTFDSGATWCPETYTRKLPTMCPGCQHSVSGEYTTCDPRCDAPKPVGTIPIRRYYTYQFNPKSGWNAAIGLVWAHDMDAAAKVAHQDVADEHERDAKTLAGSMVISESVPKDDGTFRTGETNTYTFPLPPEEHDYLCTLTPPGTTESGWHLTTHVVRATSLTEATEKLVTFTGNWGVRVPGKIEVVRITKDGTGEKAVGFSVPHFPPNNTLDGIDWKDEMTARKAENDFQATLQAEMDANVSMEVVGKKDDDTAEMPAVKGWPAAEALDPPDFKIHNSFGPTVIPAVTLSEEDKTFLNNLHASGDAVREQILRDAGIPLSALDPNSLSDADKEAVLKGGWSVPGHQGWQPETRIGTQGPTDQEKIDAVNAFAQQKMDDDGGYQRITPEPQYHSDGPTTTEIIDAPYPKFLRERGLTDSMAAMEEFLKYARMHNSRTKTTGAWPIPEDAIATVSQVLIQAQLSSKHTKALPEEHPAQKFYGRSKLAQAPTEKIETAGLPPLPNRTLGLASLATALLLLLGLAVRWCVS